jgi:hypothetical protein
MPIRPNVLAVALTALSLVTGCSWGGFSIPDPHPANSAPVLGTTGLFGGPESDYVTMPGMTLPMGISYTGSPATAWSWDFGGGAVPNTSTDEEPAVSLPTPGTYHCSVTVTNPFGSDSKAFDIIVVMPSAPRLMGVEINPPALRTGAAATIAAYTDPNQYQVFTRLTQSWSWDLGGGLQETANHERWLDVSALAPGAYHGSVTFANAGGTVTYPFDYTIAP